MKLFCLVGCYLCLVTWGCSGVPSPDTSGVSSKPIMGGSPESGWPSVGTLTSFGETTCTATVIAPRWVLTAAHCVVDGMPTNTESYFFVGPKTPGPGTYYPVAKFFAHPQYNAELSENDIALISLDVPVDSDIEPIPWNRTPIDDSLIGTILTYVGFGNNTGYHGEGSGTKRSTELPVLHVAPDYYVTKSSAFTGVCAGDSGGPGLHHVGGHWTILGVTATVVADEGDEPCLNGRSFHTRVDTYANWIGAVMSDPPDCNEDASTCRCPAACQEDGSCLDSACGAFLTCEQFAACISGCPSSDCQATCVNDSLPPVQADWLSFFSCKMAHCVAAPDTIACLEENCPSQLETCFPSSSCRLVGGDCASLACRPSTGDRTICVETQGLGPGEPCEQDATDSSCADGYTCVGTCRHLCIGDADCDPDDYCSFSAYPLRADTGVCLCRDSDHDGTCSVDDCNDDDAQVHSNCNGESGPSTGSGANSAVATSSSDGCGVSRGATGEALVWWAVLLMVFGGRGRRSGSSER